MTENEYLIPSNGAGDEIRTHDIYLGNLASVFKAELKKSRHLLNNPIDSNN